MFVLEWIIFLFVETFSDFFAEHIDISFVNVSTLVNQRNCVVDLYVFELFFVLFPILVKDKE